MNKNNDFDIIRQSPKTDQLPGSLSIQELKAFPGCGNLSDDEARKITETLFRIANLLFERPISTLTQIEINESKQAA